MSASDDIKAICQRIQQEFSASDVSEVNHGLCVTQAAKLILLYL